MSNLARSISAVAAGLFLAACQSPGDVCAPGLVQVQNDSGVDVEVTFQSMTEMQEVTLGADGVVGETIDLPAGEYRIRALDVASGAVVYDSNLGGTTLVVEGCSDDKNVRIPRPVPQPECEMGVQLGPWARIDAVPLARSVVPVCSGSIVEFEARDACGNFLSSVNAPAFWLSSNDLMERLPLPGESLDFVNGRARAIVRASVQTEGSLLVLAGGLASPPTTLGFDFQTVGISILPLPAGLAPDNSVVQCLALTASVPRIMVLAQDGCGTYTVTTESLTVTLVSENGLFPPQVLEISPLTGGNAEFILPPIPAGVAGDVYSLDVATSDFSAPPMSVSFDRDAAATVCYLLDI